MFKDSMMPIIPQNDPDMPQSVNLMLGKISKMSDNDLKEIAGKIWGIGYQYNPALPGLIKEEIIGFLSDQKEMFDLMQKLMPQPSPPTLDSSQQSEAPNPVVSNEVISLDESVAPQ